MLEKGEVVQVGVGGKSGTVDGPAAGCNASADRAAD